VTAVSPRKARRLPAELPRKPRGGLPRGRSGPAGAGAGAEEEPGFRFGPEQRESAPDGDWVLRSVPGDAFTKSYRCPGCDQEIKPGTAHVVVWPAYTPGLDQRRHWHRPCWNGRLRRHPSRRRGSG
jgi:hypothetical protein